MTPPGERRGRGRGLSLDDHVLEPRQKDKRDQQLSFDEKKLGGSIPGTPAPLSPSIRGDGVAEIKMWGDYDAEAEPDDYLHEPDAEQDRKASNKGIFSPRGVLNIGTLAVIGLGLLALFGGYPVISWLTRHKTSTKGGFNLAGINATGQVADLKIGRSLVDPDTPTMSKLETPSTELTAK